MGTMLVPIEVTHIYSSGGYREIEKGSDSLKPFLTSLWKDDANDAFYLGEGFVENFDDDPVEAPPLTEITRQQAHDWLTKC